MTKSGATWEQIITILLLIIVLVTGYILIDYFVDSEKDEQCETTDLGNSTSYNSTRCSMSYNTAIGSLFILFVLLALFSLFLVIYSFEEVQK